MSERQHHLLAQCFQAGPILHVAGQAQRFRSELLDLVRHGVHLGLVAAAGDRDRAGFGVSPGNRLSDAARAAQDDGDFVFDGEQIERAHKQVMIQYGIRFPETHL